MKNNNVVIGKEQRHSGSSRGDTTRDSLVPSLRDDVMNLCSRDRTVGSSGLAATARMIASRLEKEASIAHKDLHATFSREAWPYGITRLENLYFSIGQDKPELPLVIIGAHYDAVSGSPGADDNASSVAVLLELAHFLTSASATLPVRVDLAFWGGEEAPVFASCNMGSHRHAASSRKRGEIPVLVMVLEMLGFYTGIQEVRSVRCRLDDGSAITAILPECGDFLLTAGSLPDTISARLSESLKDNGVSTCNLGAVTYLHSICDAMNWLDYPVALITDTGMLRGYTYHTPDDRPELLDYGVMAKIVRALASFLAVPKED